MAKRRLKAKQVWERLGVAESTFYKMITDGEFPKAKKRNNEKSSFWMESVVEAWLDKWEEEAV